MISCLHDVIMKSSSGRVALPFLLVLVLANVDSAVRGALDWVGDRFHTPGLIRTHDWYVRVCKSSGEIIPVAEQGTSRNEDGGSVDGTRGPMFMLQEDSIIWDLKCKIAQTTGILAQFQVLKAPEVGFRAYDAPVNKAGTGTLMCVIYHGGAPVNKAVSIMEGRAAGCHIIFSGSFSFTADLWLLCRRSSALPWFVGLSDLIRSQFESTLFSTTRNCRGPCHYRLRGKNIRFVF